MTLITHDTRVSELETSRTLIAATLKSITFQIVELKLQVEQGNLGHTKEVGQASGGRTVLAEGSQGNGG